MNSNLKIIGIDFDNTIIQYDQLFYREAKSNQLIPGSVDQTKTAVRNHLRSVGKEQEWTRLQGQVYGEKISGASPSKNVKSSILTLKSMGFIPAIISHKTRYPYIGDKVDLHEAAMGWLYENGFFDPDEMVVDKKMVFFNSTIEDKIKKISELQCSVFVDDLPEVLDLVPEGVERVLYSTVGGPHREVRSCQVVTDWLQVPELLGHHGAA